MNMRRLINLVEDANTPTAFERWYSGSKIVDADGNPLKLYHGTSKDQDFKSFRMPKNGVWFTPDPTEASDYAKENDSQGYKLDGHRIINTHTAARVIPVYVRAVNPFYVDAWPEEIQRDNYRKAQAQWFDTLRMRGHDALVFKGGRIVVALESPNQIKSAIGNKTFDPKKKGLTEDSGQTATPDELVKMMMKIHYHPQDFNEGDINFRIWKFTVYELGELPVADLHTPWRIDDDRVVAYAERMKAGEIPPPIIWDAESNEPIDGGHRIAAAKLAGITSLPAYIGKPENLDPYWDEDELE